MFCLIDRAILAETKLSLAFFDAFPVSNGHTLVIPKWHVITIWDLSAKEYVDVDLVRRVKDILQQRFEPHGVNVGPNCGEAAGQTVFHAQTRHPSVYRRRAESKGWDQQHNPRQSSY
jgi:diadenosine tetraphosphate (Ap4A) HIT family hydrolase